MLRVAVAVCCVLVALAHPTPVLDSALDGHWELFKATHNKQYANNQEETLR